MKWSRPQLLIPDDRLRFACTLRVWVGLAATTLGFVACRQNWANVNFSFPATTLGGLLLLLFSLAARRWKRERGLWMMFALFIACSLWMYSITLQAPTLAWGSLYQAIARAWTNSGAATPATPRALVEAIDATVGGTILLANIRLQASAAVANFRRFRRRPNAEHAHDGTAE